MQKRGQVTIYAIVGILITIILIGVYYYNSEKVKRELTPENVVFNSQAQQVRALINGCFENKVKMALIIVGFQGGYIVYPEPGYEVSRGIISGYGLYDGRNLLPSKDEISSEISEFVNLDIENCVDFSKLSFKVEEDKRPSSRIVINDDNVVAKLSWPVSVSKLEKSIKFDSVYNVNIPVSLGRLIDVSDDVVEYMKGHDGYVNINYLEDSGFKVDIGKLDEKQNVIRFTDENLKINNENYVFQFVNKVN